MPKDTGYWTDERVEELKKLWASGLSAGRIAARLGRPDGRSAVIGKVHRLGLSGRPTTARIKPHNPNAPKLKKQSWGFGAGKPKPATTAAAPRSAEPPVEPTLNTLALPPEDARPASLLRFAELENHHCRYIYGDPRHADHGYCGQPRVEGLFWCPRHVERVFAVAPVRTGRQMIFRGHPGSGAVETPATRNPRETEEV